MVRSSGHHGSVLEDMTHTTSLSVSGFVMWQQRFFLFFFLLTLGTLCSGKTIQCPGSDSGSCKCQSTDGVLCPPGYYCPGYTVEQIADNNQTISDANCLIRSDGQLECPCSPGFFCPENTSTPSYCCTGHFCKTPEVIEKCKKGHFCKTGYVEGIPCGSNEDCPAGSDQSSRTGAFTGIIIIGVILRLMFWVKYYVEYRVKESENMTFSNAKVADAIAPSSVGNDLQDGVLPPHFSQDDEETQRKPPAFNLSKAALSVPDSEYIPGPVVNEDDSFVIRFENVGLTLPSGVTIMKGVCGEFKPKRMCAIMGPSGAGKTTIINLITGKAAKTSGSIIVNGSTVKDLSKWKKLVGFVPQEDIMIRQLTVRDNLAFSAHYRLPIEMSAQEKTQVVNDTLLSLGISHVQHSVIGDERERGVSGGQRKRVNIGIEMVALPKVLFLDEPTSGLDSTSSVVLARQLKSIATRENVTIASVIHQPSIQAFLEFDDLLLLGKGGEVVYHGPVETASDYFESIGFVSEGLTNPADFYLDIANGVVERLGDPDFQPADLFRFWRNTMKNLPIDAIEEEEPKIGVQYPVSICRRTIAVNSDAHERQLAFELNPLQSWIALRMFLKSIFQFFWSLLLNFYLDRRAMFIKFAKEITRNDDVRNTPGFWGQLHVCLIRACKQKYRRFGGIMGQMLVHLGVALVVSSASTDLQYVGPLPDVVCAVVTRDLYVDCTSALVDGYQGTANFLCFGVIFAAIAVSAGTFGNEQVNYWRECAAGLKTVPYFLAKWIVETPNIVMAALFFWLAFLIRFPNTNESARLFELFLAVYWWAWSLGFLLSTIASPKNVFLLGVLAALLYAVAFSGASPTIHEVHDMSAAVRWLWSLSGTRWALEGFYVSQVEYYETVPSGPLEGEPYMDIKAGLNVIGYNIDNFSKSVGALMWNGFGYGLVAMVLMAFTNHDKKK